MLPATGDERSEEGMDDSMRNSRQTDHINVRQDQGDSSESIAFTGTKVY